MDVLRFGLSAAALSLSLAAAAREVSVDAGVMRWRDDGGEVTLFGVNYYAPFYKDYAGLVRKGLDVERVIDTDLLHIRRLGLDCVRVHVFDCQISDGDGHLTDNEHLRLFDYLVARCATDGLRLVLTPIAWWKESSEKGTLGFSARWKMSEMTGDRASWSIQCRYLREFGEHVNRYTGRRLADEPAVVAFELINEPRYREGLSDADVTAYVDALAAAMRATGTRKPLFYNAWQGRDAAVAASSVDGMTGVAYSTGLEYGRRRKGALLGCIDASTLGSAKGVTDKAKMIYEFDTADTTDAYLYPAMARMFRSEGVQVAAQFQYDVLPLASENGSWRTHYLNLVYTPAKALSLAVAREAMHRLARGTDFVRETRRMSFGPFVLDAASGSSVLADGAAYLSSGDTDIPAPTPTALRRIWGCGSSPLVATTGNGCYFLDFVRPGVWRLQLYPNVREIADPFTGRPGPKVVVAPTPTALKLSVPDLGPSFRVWRFESGALAAGAEGGRVALSAGDYLLTVSETLEPSVRTEATAADVPAFAAPDAAMQAGAAPTWAEAADVLRARGVTKPEEWRLYEATLDEEDGCPRRFGADDFRKKDCVRMTFAVDVRPLVDRFPALRKDAAVALAIRMRAVESERIPVEVAVRTQDGVSWICMSSAGPEECEVRLPLADFRVADWSAVKDPKGGPVPDSISGVSFALGKWLFARSPERPRHLEVGDIRLRPGTGTPGK